MASNILGSLIINLLTKADTTGLSKTDRAIQKTTKTVKTLNKETGLIGKLSGKLMGGLNIDMVRNAFVGYLQFEKQLGSIHSRFYAITKDSQKANQQFEFARKIAKETATDINSVVDSYSIFYSSAQRALGESGAQEVYSNWTKVSRVLHLSGAQYERVMYALREMSSKGQLYAQDLMIQMGTHVPDIRNVAETAIKRLDLKGVTSIKDFQEYTKKNTGSDAMSRFLVEFSREARHRFASDEALKKALQQPDALVQELKNVGFDIMYEFSKSGGSYMMIKILQGVANFISTIPFDRITNFLGRVAHVVGDIFTYLPQIVSILTKIALTLLTIKISTSLLKFLGNMRLQWALLKMELRSLSPSLAGGVIQGFTKLGFKTVASRLLAFLGGPWGIVLSLLITFLPKMSDIFNWIRQKLGADDRNRMLDYLVRNTGLTRDEAISKLQKVQEVKPKDFTELTKVLSSPEFSSLAPYVSIDQNSNIYVNLNGEYLQASLIGDAIVDTKTNTTSNKYGYKPKISHEESVKLARRH